MYNIYQLPGKHSAHRHPAQTLQIYSHPFYAVLTTMTTTMIIMTLPGAMMLLMPNATLHSYHPQYAQLLIVWLRNENAYTSKHTYTPHNDERAMIQAVVGAWWWQLIVRMMVYIL